MKAKITSRRSWPRRLAFRDLTPAIAQAPYCHSFVLAVAAFGLLALPPGASGTNKAHGLQNRSAIPKKLAASNRGSIIRAADEAKRSKAVAVPAIVIPHAAPAVTNTNDSGSGSLRQALADAQDGDTITFNISPAPPPNAPSIATVITLTSGELVVNKNITISGPGADTLAIARDANALPFRIFNISPGHTITIQGLTISNGQEVAGGGIYNDHSVLTVDLCALAGNSASGSTYAGGGIYNDGANSGNATLLVTHSLLKDNSAPNGFGGGIASVGLNGGSATLNVVDSTLSGNSASLGGGAIHQDTGGSGGNASLMIASSTLSGNSGAAGIYSTFSSLKIGNTILKAGGSGPNIFKSGGFASSAGYNLSNDDGGGVLTAAGDQLNTDPMLGPLKDNGGPTLTYAPLVNSPAIDQGRSDTIPALGVVSDQRAFTRPVDDAFVPNHPGGDGSDIGAVELAVGVHPTSAASSKTHGEAGSFAINLPLTGLGLECRSGGMNNDYQIIMTFAQPVTFSSAAVTSGVGAISTMSVSSGTGGSAGTQLTINLTGVTNVQIITVALFDVDDGTKHSDVGVRMGVLVGDATDNANVNASDISQVKFQSGQEVGADNFRADVIANGAINATDVSAVKSKSGTGLP